MRSSGDVAYSSVSVMLCDVDGYAAWSHVMVMFSNARWGSG